jgi:hypothetical protein
MSAVVLIAPMIVAGWPAICAAVGSAATALGYALSRRGSLETTETARECRVELEVKDSQVVGESLRPEERLVFERGGVTLIFEKDPRGHCRLVASGMKRTRSELLQTGREFLSRFTQQFVHDKIRRELASRGYTVVNEEVRPDRSIHIKLRRWE